MGVITGFNNGNFKSAEYVYSKIKREFKTYGGVNLLDDTDFPLYTAEVLKKLGAATFKEEDAFIKVKDGKAKLPDDFMYLYAAYKCGHGSGETKSKNFQNEDLFEHDITCEIVKRSAACTMEFDCGGQGDKIIQKIRIKRYVNDTAHSDYEYHHPRLLKLSPNVKSKCVDDCVNFSHHHHCHKHDEITITNGTILTNFNDGHIYMQYYAFPYDEDGLPMIPDVLEVEKAVEWYIKSQILLNFWFADDVANVQTKWQKAEVEAEKWMAEARYIGRLPSFSGMVNSIRNKRGLNKVHFFSQMDNKQQ